MPPALIKAPDEAKSLNDPHLRSAVGLSLTRTIELLKKLVSYSMGFHWLLNDNVHAGILDRIMILKRFGTNIHILSLRKEMP
jgi:hypothetical protein